MRDKNYTLKNLRNGVNSIIRQIHLDHFEPDYVVGLTRGGLMPALMISHYLDVPMHTLNVSLRTTNDSYQGPESNLWMAEEAFGLLSEEEQAVNKSRWDVSKRKNILIVDDINDTGATFNWIKQDWQSSCFPKETTSWQTVWAKNVKIAVLINNEASQFKDVHYVGDSINKLDEPDVWYHFPWECWWHEDSFSG